MLKIAEAFCTPEGPIVIAKLDRTRREKMTDFFHWLVHHHNSLTTGNGHMDGVEDEGSLQL